MKLLASPVPKTGQGPIVWKWVTWSWPRSVRSWFVIVA